MDSDGNKSSVGKKVKIFYDRFKYEGLLIYEDSVIYRIKDIKEGVLNIPKNNSMMKEVE